MRARWPDRAWVQLDLNEPDDVERALDGCEAAYYLVHSLTENPSGLFEREQRVAEIFALAAERARLGRIVYLGATSPQGSPSEHLRSRSEVGRVLRSGAVPGVEACGHDCRIRQRIVAYRARPGGAAASHDLADVAARPLGASRD